MRLLAVAVRVLHSTVRFFAMRNTERWLSSADAAGLQASNALICQFVCPEMVMLMMTAAMMNINCAEISVPSWPNGGLFSVRMSADIDDRHDADVNSWHFTPNGRAHEYKIVMETKMRHDSLRHCIVVTWRVLMAQALPGHSPSNNFAVGIRSRHASSWPRRCLQAASYS